MLICRIAYDAKDKDNERKANYEAHRAYLRSDAATHIVQSGPLFSSDGSNTKIGALIVFDVASVEAAEQFNTGDPFIRAGVYHQVELLRWDRSIG